MLRWGLLKNLKQLIFNLGKNGFELKGSEK